MITQIDSMTGELKYKDITEKINGNSFEVHKFFGNGFKEVIYQGYWPGSCRRQDCPIYGN